MLAASGEGLSLDQMAVEMNVERRTAERMRDALAALFPQMEALPDGRSKRFRIPGGLDGFLQAPTADELAELHTAIASLEASGAEDRAALLRSLSEKVRAAIRGPARRRIDPDLDALLRAELLVMQAGPRPMASPETLATIREALKSMRTCVFAYAGAGETAPWAREVIPYGVLFGRSCYLVGPEIGKAEPVLWRLDRIIDIDIGEACDGPPPAFDLAAFAARSFGAFQEPPEDVALRFDPSAAAAARAFAFHPGQTLEEQPDGSVIVRFRAGGLLELARHLFTWGAAVEILAPSKLREMMTAELRSALSHHAR